MKAPEKIYISNYSSGLTYNWHPERLAIKDIEYTRTDAFVEKAVIWLKENADYYIVHYRNNDVTCLDKSFIEDFINYMEGE